ncbi:Reverse transcriptase (RNA-dependent DNA polymerase) [Nesidiocoris tenuis]|uniref:Reverse transcriptase (RNA-dependent DNA polymerase) n=1 Tax=Nesidiocoris tenuis TaxID=355587 RepID=A0ABN7AV06_9HEMI|nr:Reverse transcriptase (RNA-dependent DNA polymerase) [Nesidiocoris tenuis]
MTFWSSTVVSSWVTPGVLYAVPAWWPALSPRSGLEKKLGSAQKAVLLKVVRAYRTTSGVGVTVLAGVLPVRLEAARRHAGYCIAKRLPFAAGGLRVDEAGAAALTRPELTGGPAGWSLGLVEYPLSPQGDGEETAEHILLDCARFVSRRIKVEDAIFLAGGREDWTRYILPA